MCRRRSPSGAQSSEASSNTFLWSIAVLLLSAGLILRYVRFAPGVNHYIYGDLTDAYFNLWILEHLRSFFSTGDWRTLFDTSFFWPDNHLAFFWSDNLLAIVPFYWPLRVLLGDCVAAFNATTLLFVMFGYVACLHFYLTVYRLVKNATGTVPDWSILLVPAVAYVAAFGDARVMYTAHFQNQSANIVILAASFGLRFVESRNRYDGWAALGLQVVVCYTAPYYAVMLGMLGVTWACNIAISEGRLVFRRVIREQAIPLAIAGCVILPIALGYFIVRQKGAQVALESCAEFRHFVVPWSTSRLAAMMNHLGWAAQNYSHESLSFIGIFGLSLIFLALVYLFSRFVKSALRCGFIFGIGFILVWSSRIFHFPQPLAVAGLLGLLALAFMAFQDAGPHRRWLLFLFSGVLLFYGTAFGPSSAYPAGTWDVSLWGVFAKLVPGYQSIRAVGRFGALGTVYLLAFPVAALALMDRGRPRKLFVGVGLCLLLGSSAIDHSNKPYLNSYDFTAIEPDAAAERFFTDRNTTMAVIPTNNLSLIPTHMIYFERFKGVRLFNGYSGRFPPTFWRYCRQSDWKLSPEAVRELYTLGIRELLWDRRAIGLEEIRGEVQRIGGEIEFETNGYVISTLPPETAVR